MDLDKDFEDYMKIYDKLYNSKKYNKLIIIINKYLYKYDNDLFNSLLLKNKGQCFNRINQRENAIKCFEESLKLENDDRDYLEESIAINYYFIKNYSKAFNELKKLVLKGTKNPMIISIYLEIYIKTDQEKEAYDFLCKNKNKLKVFDNDPDYLGQYGRILKYLEKYNEAILYFKKSFKYKSECFWYNQDLGDCYFYTNDFKNALLYYKKMKRYSNKLDLKQLLDLYERLLIVYEKLDKVKKSEYYKTKCVKLNDKINIKESKI